MGLFCRGVNGVFRSTIKCLTFRLLGFPVIIKVSAETLALLGQLPVNWLIS